MPSHPAQNPNTVKRPGGHSIGVVAISYNEQENIRPFIDHLLPWVDDIVIIDDGSTDETVSIASDYGPKVRLLQAPREDGEYFSHQRNKGIAASRCDWLLHMDIDERVSPQLAREILQRTQDPSYLAFRFRRLNHFMNRPMSRGGWETWNQVHLARRDTLRFAGMFHENVELSCTTTETGQLNSYMYHLNEPDLRTRLRKSDTYLEEMIADIQSSHASVSAWHLFIYPLKEFLKRYVIRRGFLDGVAGWISAVHSATAVFRAYALVWDMQHPASREDLEHRIAKEWQSTNLGSDTGRPDQEEARSR